MEAWLVENCGVDGIVYLSLFVSILIHPRISDPFVKVRFLSTFNTAPSTSSHDWNNIGNVPVSSDFVRSSILHCR